MDRGPGGSTAYAAKPLFCAFTERFCERSNPSGLIVVYMAPAAPVRSSFCVHIPATILGERLGLAPVRSAETVAISHVAQTVAADGHLGHAKPLGAQDCGELLAAALLAELVVKGALGPRCTVGGSARGGTSSIGAFLRRTRGCGVCGGECHPRGQNVVSVAASVILVGRTLKARG